MCYIFLYVCVCLCACGCGRGDAGECSADFVAFIESINGPSVRKLVYCTHVLSTSHTVYHVGILLLLITQCMTKRFPRYTFSHLISSLLPVWMPSSLFILFSFYSPFLRVPCKIQIEDIICNHTW